MSCVDYNGECSAFSDFLTEAIELSSDNKFAPAAQFKLKKKYDELLKVIEDGKAKLDKSK